MFLDSSMSLNYYDCTWPYTFKGVRDCRAYHDNVRGNDDLYFNRITGIRICTKLNMCANVSNDRGTHSRILRTNMNIHIFCQPRSKWTTCTNGPSRDVFTYGYKCNSFNFISCCPYHYSCVFHYINKINTVSFSEREGHRTENGGNLNIMRVLQSGNEISNGTDSSLERNETRLDTANLKKNDNEPSEHLIAREHNENRIVRIALQLRKIGDSFDKYAYEVL